MTSVGADKTGSGSLSGQARLDRIAGAVLGTAVGDALGLPRENLSPRRAARLYGAQLQHRFVFGRGMVSDDTEHTAMVGQALLREPSDPHAFARSLAWRLRLWLLCMPAGIGWATLRSILKMWIGLSPARSGVWSAGNGPAMRAALLGVCLGDDLERLKSFVRASTRVTHTDPRAERGAMLVALAAHHGAELGANGIDGRAFLQGVRGNAEGDDELNVILNTVEEHLQRNAPAAELARAFGLQKGVTGYIYHTVPVALYGWLRWPGDFRKALSEIIALGGDADTTGAIVGGMVGATVGSKGIPKEWMDGLIDWPCSVCWLEDLAKQLSKRFPSQGNGVGSGPPGFFWPGLVPRNLLFFGLVMAHMLRRLLPPY